MKIKQHVLEQNTKGQRWNLKKKSRNILKQMKMEAQYRKQYLQYAEKIVLRRKFIATNTYIKKWGKTPNKQLKFTTQVPKIKWELRLMLVEARE